MKARLGDYIREYSVRNKANENIPVYSVTNSQGFCKDYFGKEVASKDKSTYKIVPKGCFAYNPSRINVGSVDWQRNEEKVIVSPLYNVFSVSPELNNQYLYYFLKSDIALWFIKSIATGSVRDNLKLSMLYEFPINLPNIEKQQEIVSTLDTLQSIITHRRTQLEKLDLLVKARFVEMFGTYPANEYDWEIGTIRDLVTEVRYGSSRKASDNNSGKYPYLRMNNITYSGELDLSDTKTIDIPDKELPKCTVRKGDVLFNRTNSKELVGKTCVYNRDEKMVLAGFIIRIRLNEKMLPDVLSSFLNTDFSKRMLLEMCKTAIGQANINAQEMQNIGIYIPPIELQEKFVTFKRQVDKSKATIQKALDEAQLLFDSLMQEYFG
ncbi:restriction endonuclease subunit S [Ruminococcus sp.]